MPNCCSATAQQSPKILVAGENPAITLREKEGGPPLTSVNFWRVHWSPVGSGAVCFVTVSGQGNSDLRIAVYWTRACMHLEGVASLTEGLRLMLGLLSRYWEELHPMPDDGDAYARVNALNEMGSLRGMLGDLRDSLVLNDRSVGELRGRDVEVALGVLEPRSGDVAYSRSTVEQMLSEGAQSKPEVREFPARALAQVAELQQLMRDRVGYASAPELEALVTTLTGLRDVMPAADAGEGAAGEGGSGEAEGESPRRGGGRPPVGGRARGIRRPADLLAAGDRLQPPARGRGLDCRPLGWHACPRQRGALARRRRPSG